MRSPDLTERRVRVWDLPTRIFHWTLVALVVVSFYTGQVGGLTEMDIHMASGYAILTLLIFRLVWGIVGGTHARFAGFVRGPGAVMRYLRDGQPETAGHSPLGALSVVALLLVLLVQAGTGLFANDDIFLEGPLAHLVDKETSNRLTGLHHLVVKGLVGLVGLHLAALAAYRLRGKNLVPPMVTGVKTMAAPTAPADATGGHPLLGLVVLAVAAAMVWGLLRL